MSGSGWCTIESDPGVFSELITKIGVKGVQVAECFDLDQLDTLKPVYGLIFLFKWQKDDKDNRVVLNPLEVPNVFFAKQVINNACATQAIISVLMNRPDIKLGDELENFKSFAGSLPPEMRGLVIGNSETIKKVHNSFARPEPFMFESKTATEDDDVYHFIGYVPVQGNLYELDGLKGGPIHLGECTLDNWLDKAKPAIRERIQRYSQKEIRFNLLALVKDRQETLTEQVEALQKTKSELEAKLGKDDESEGEAKKDVQSQLLITQNNLAELKTNLQNETEKREKWRIENIRRRHNYIPFVFNLLKILAEKDKLLGLMEEGQKSLDAREAKKKEDKEKEKKKAEDAKKKKEEENKKAKEEADKKAKEEAAKKETEAGGTDAGTDKN